MEFDFLFDGGWFFKGELAIFNLEGMETYNPGSLEFIQEAANRALTNSDQGHILLKDNTEGARFSSSLPWEEDHNHGTYQGVKTLTMNPGDRFGFMLIQHTTVQEIANDPHQISQWGKLPIFSIPEANPYGSVEGQMVAVDSNGTLAFEDVRLDWGKGDRDYNDLIFQVKGLNGIVPSIDELVNPERDWRGTTLGQELLEYAANNTDNLLAMTSQTTQALRQGLLEYDVDSTSNLRTMTSETTQVLGQELLKYETNSLNDGDNLKLLFTESNDKNYEGYEVLIGDDCNNKLVGDDGMDILIGVNPNSSQPGIGEVDQLKGGKNADTFVLGNLDKVYYTSMGDEDFALIRDFNIKQGDVILLSGKREDYVLGTSPFEKQKDMAIFLESSFSGVANELIGIIKGGNNLNLELNGEAFQFLG